MSTEITQANGHAELINPEMLPSGHVRVAFGEALIGHSAVIDTNRVTKGFVRRSRVALSAIQEAGQAEQDKGKLSNAVIGAMEDRELEYIGMLATLVVSHNLPEGHTFSSDAGNKGDWTEDWPFRDVVTVRNSIKDAMMEYVAGPKDQTSTPLPNGSTPTEPEPVVPSSQTLN